MKRLIPILFLTACADVEPFGSPFEILTREVER